MTTPVEIGEHGADGLADAQHIADGPPQNSEDEEDAEERIARSRERNREHARRTRLRKKAQLQALQSRVTELQAESRLLKQTVEECSIASILLGLSGNQEGEELCEDISDLTKPRENDPANFCATLGGKRKRFLSDADQNPQPMKLKIKGQTTVIGGGDGKTHINWKSGVYCDEQGVQRQLSPDELETLRRERNRMHAKMTRDRKKNFISTVEKTIADLERENKRMRETLAKQASHRLAKNTASPSPSPLLTAASTPKAATITPVLQPVPTQVSASSSATSTPSPTPPPTLSIEMPAAAENPLPADVAKVSESSTRVTHGFNIQG